MEHRPLISRCHFLGMEHRPWGVRKQGMTLLRPTASLHPGGHSHTMVCVLRILPLLLSLVVGFVSFPAHASVIRKSNSGLCHPPPSSWYERTKNYQSYDSLDACLDSGGKLPDGVSFTSVGQAQEQQSRLRSYERSAFGHGWDDADEGCQDSRAEALAAQSTTNVRFADESRCRVVSGRWISPFTGKVIENSSEIDIDHVVPLKWAWKRGAKDWAQSKRERFANDMVNFWPVELSLNRSKGALGPNEWLPPSRQCGYVARFVRNVKHYDLKPTKPEALWLKAFLKRCRT